MAYYPRQHIATQFPGYTYPTDFIYNDMVELTAVDLHWTRHGCQIAKSTGLKVRAKRSHQALVT